MLLEVYDSRIVKSLVKIKLECKMGVVIKEVVFVVNVRSRQILIYIPVLSLV